MPTTESPTDSARLSAVAAEADNYQAAMESLNHQRRRLHEACLKALESGERPYLVARAARLSRQRMYQLQNEYSGHAS
jgi:hypothetical protein